MDKVCFVLSTAGCDSKDLFFFFSCDKIKIKNTLTIQFPSSVYYLPTFLLH